jgi:hypothetical protein
MVDEKMRVAGTAEAGSVEKEKADGRPDGLFLIKSAKGREGQSPKSLCYT